MPGPSSILCPHCQAKLKLSNPKLIGRKIRCPKCSEPFKVSVPEDSNAELSALDEFDSFEDAAGDYEDDYESEPDYQPPLPSRRPSKSSKQKAGKKKSKSGSAGWMKPVLFGGLGLVAVGALVGVGLLAVKLASMIGGQSDLAYLPADADVVVQVRVAQVWNSPIVQSVAANETVRGLADQLQDQAGLEAGDVDSVLYGAADAGRLGAGGGRWLAVVRTRQPLDQQKIQALIGAGEAQNHHGGDYYVGTGAVPAGGATALHFAGDRLLFLGSENEVKTAIEGGRAPKRPELSAVDFSRHVVFVNIPRGSDAASLRSGAGTFGPLGNLPGDLRGKVTANSIGLTFSAGIDIQGQTSFQDSDSAAQALEKMNEEMENARKMLEQQRQRMAQAPAHMAAFQKMAEDSLALSEAMLNSTKITRSGNNVRITAALPESVKSAVEQMLPMFAGMMAMGLQMQAAALPDATPVVTPGSGAPSMPASLGGPDGQNRTSDPREAAQRAACRNNLKQLGIALHNYHDANRTFPAEASRSSDGRPLLSWRVELLPFLGHADLHQRFHHDEPWDSPHNRSLIPLMPDVFKCLGNPTASGRTTYLAARGPGLMFEDGQPIGLRDVRDGTSNTILVVEAGRSQAVEWTKPDDPPIDRQNPLRGLSGAHARGFHALFCDGSVQFIENSIAPADLWAKFTRAGAD